MPHRRLDDHELHWLKDIYPGAGDYAAAKVHKTLSVGGGSVIDYHFSSARDHDSPRDLGAP